MNLQQLQYFTILAEHEHYTRAAEALYITQPTLSYAITELEKELGVQLFDKYGKKIRLSQPGKVFLEYVKTALNTIDEGTKAIDAMKSEIAGTVNIACIYSFGSTLLPQIIKEFYIQKEMENILFSFIQGVNADALDSLSAGKADIAFCSNPGKDVENVIVYNQELIVVLPHTHPLASKSEITLDEIRDEAFVLVNNRSGLRHRIDQIFKEAKIKPHIAFEVEECNSVIAFVSNGLGVGIVSKTPFINKHSCAVIPFKNTPHKRHVYMAWQKNKALSPATCAFRDYVLDLVEFQALTEIFTHEQIVTFDAQLK